MYPLIFKLFRLADGDTSNDKLLIFLYENRR